MADRAAHVLRPLLNAVLPARPMGVTVLSGPAQGAKIVIEPRREKAYWLGTHEAAVQSALMDAVQPGMTVWDIGAHAGFFTVLCSRLAGPTGHVHSFEPGTETRARLEETIRLNELQNVVVHACAVGAERREGVLHSVGRSAQATMRAIGTRAHSSSPVEVRTLSDLWEELGPPNVIKIDAEGAELDIVEGGAEALGKGIVTLVVELHRQATADRLLRLVPEHGRDRIDETHWLLRFGGATAPGA